MWQNRQNRKIRKWNRIELIKSKIVIKNGMNKTLKRIEYDDYRRIEKTQRKQNRKNRIQNNKNRLEQKNEHRRNRGNKDKKIQNQQNTLVKSG